MFMLTHAHTALEVFKKKKLTSKQHDHLIVGSILPDVSELKIAPEVLTHTKGIEFMNYLSQENRFLGIGAILHGHKPYGLDYYTHQGFYKLGVGNISSAPRLNAQSGCIARYYKEIFPVLENYKKSFGKFVLSDALHFTVEFCFDHLVSQKNPELADRVHTAMKNCLESNVILNFANFFEIDKKQLKRLKKVLKSRHAKKILHNFSTIEGTAHNLQNFIFLKTVREKNSQSKYRFLGKMAQVTKSSLGFLQTKLHDRSLVQMFERSVEVVKKDFQPFLDSAVTHMKSMLKKEKII